MSFRLVPKSVTLNDLERRNGRYFALFHRTGVRCHRKTIVSVSKSTFNNLIFGQNKLITRFDGHSHEGA